jgi:hypothetical protein
MIVSLMGYFVNQIRVKKKTRLRDWVGWDKWVKIGNFRQFVEILLVFNRKIDVGVSCLVLKDKLGHCSIQ